MADNTALALPHGAYTPDHARRGAASPEAVRRAYGGTCGIARGLHTRGAGARRYLVRTTRSGSMPHPLDTFAAAAPSGFWGGGPARLQTLAAAYGVTRAHDRAIGTRISAAAKQWAAAREADGSPAAGPAALASSPSTPATPVHRRPVGRAAVARAARTARADAVAAARTTARNWLALGLALAPEEVIERLRMDGVLRASTYGWSHEVPAELADDVRQFLAAHAPPGTAWADGALRYLESESTLHALAPTLRRQRARLAAELRADGLPGLLGLLATVDVLFAGVGVPEAWVRRWPPALAARSRYVDTDPTAREVLAEAATDCWALFAETVGPPGSAHGPPLLDATAAADGRFLMRLAAAVVLRKAREWEEMVDVHDYQAVRTGQQRVAVRPPTPDFERAARLGFVNAWQQRVVAAHSTPAGVMRLGDFARRLAARFPKLLRAHLVAHPVPRYRIEFGVIEPLMAQLAEPQLFDEEAGLMEELLPEHLIDVDGLRSFVLQGGVTMWDLIVVQRAVRLISTPLRDAVKASIDDTPAVALRTVLPTFTTEQLVTIFGPLVGAERVPSLLALLTGDPADPRYDLQYRPLQRLAGGGYVLPINVLAHSHIVRNAWQATGERVHKTTRPDPAEVILAEAIRAQGGRVALTLEYSHDGRKGEVDVLALIDGVLVVVEFKRTILPAMPREWRGTTEHMRKAARQLTHFAAAWADPAFRASVAARLGKLDASEWDADARAALVGADRVYTVIALSNRMFSGWREEGHPVRGMPELLRFFTDGIIVLRPDATAPSGGPQRPLAVWAGDRLSATDVHAYLAEDVVHAATLGCMEEIRHAYDVGPTRVLVESYGLDTQRVGAALAARFRPVDVPAAGGSHTGGSGD